MAGHTQEQDLRTASEFLMAHLGDPEDAQPCGCFPDPSGLRGALERVREALRAAPPRPVDAERVDPNPAIDASEGTPLTVDYINYRGERGTRHILPGRIVYGATEYHPRHQWLLEAFDLDKSAMRVFAMEDMQFLKPSAHSPDKAVTREGVDLRQTITNILIAYVQNTEVTTGYQGGGIDAIAWSRRDEVVTALLAALAPKPTGTEEAHELLRQVLLNIDVHEEAGEYELRADSDYKPNEFEQQLLEEFGCGLIATIEDAVRAALPTGTEVKDGHAFLAEVKRISGDFIPDSDKDAALALGEMREALVAAVEAATPTPPVSPSPDSAWPGSGWHPGFPPKPWSERLSFRSSVLFAPWFLIPDDGIEDGDELSGGCDDGDELWLSGCDEFVAEGFECRVVSCCDHGAHEEGGSDGGSSSADEALAAPLPGLAGPGREPDERRDLAPVERAELGQLGDQGSGDRLADAGHGGEEIFLVAPSGRAAHRVVDVAVEAGEFLFQGLDQPHDALGDAGRGALLALALGPDHRHDLAPAGDQIGQKLGRLIGQRPHRGLRRLDEMGDHGGVDQVGLGALAQRVGESAHLRRVDHDDRQASPGKTRRDHRLEPARRLDRNGGRAQRPEPLDQSRDPVPVAPDEERLSARPDSHVQPVLRHIDSNDDGGVHPVPSLRKRASRRAAQATVRGRWIGRRRPKLTHGLGVPQGFRSPACHRNRSYSR